MKVKFKNGTRMYECNEPIEQKLFRQGIAVGWMMILQLTENMTSLEIDELITPESMSELSFETDDGKTEFCITGYTSLTSCVIRHKTQYDAIIEFQFSKNH